MSRRAPPPTKPVPEEEDEIEDDDDEEMEEYPDMFEALGSLLATDEGDTLATLQLRQAEALEKMAVQFEMQNKILVKILSAMGKCKCTPAPVVAEETA
jgi:hypothetical protein